VVVRLFCLTLSAAALAYAVLDKGGRTAIGWNASLLVFGIASAIYFLNRKFASYPFLLWAILLPPAYVALQLVPLPLPLLRLLSPAKASLLDRLAPLAPVPSFAPLSIDPATTIAYLVRMLAYSLAILVIGDITWHERDRPSWAPVIPLIAIAALEAVLGIVQSTSGSRATGTYIDRNHFAGLLEMGLPLAAAYAFAQFRKPLQASLGLAAAAAMLAGLVYSLSKSGFVAGLAALFTMAALWIVTTLHGARRWMSVAAITALFVLVFVFFPTDQLVSAYGHDFATDTTGEGRLPIWSDSLKLLHAYPVFGSGLGTFGTAFQKYQTALVELSFGFAHNDYLELASELGAVGFLIFASLALFAIVQSVRAAFSNDWNTRLIGLGCVGSITAIAIHSFTEFNLYTPANALFLAWIAGIALFYQSAPKCTIRTVPLLFALVLVTFAPAWIFFELNFKNSPVAEKFCRFGICDTYAVVAPGVESDPVAPKPPAELLEALQRDPGAPDRWCDLGEALFKAGRVQQARYCFSNALALGPEVPQILIRNATFYHAIDEDDRALKQTSEVLERSTAYEDYTFDWYRDQKFSPETILSHGLPPGAHAEQAYLRYWMNLGDVESASTVWKSMLAHDYPDAATRRDYVNFLFRSQRYQEAATAFAAPPGVFNGDFKTEPSGVPFDWNVGYPDVDEAIESHSFRIHFTGTKNVDYAHTIQQVFVTPGVYRFTAFIRTQSITTDQGIAVQILNVKTDQFVGTTDRKKIELTIRVPRETKLLAIQLVRHPSRKFDNQISGTAWIDHVSLSKIL
jgi:O-antigen ligase